MTTPHKATPEQWEIVTGKFGATVPVLVELIASCVHELRDRLAAAEQRISELEGNRQGSLDSSPAPAIGPEWRPCVKLPITVHVREQRPGETHIGTREGITPVRPDDLIMRGIQGEEYPIGRELFNRTYRMGEAVEPQAPAPAGGLVESVMVAMQKAPFAWEDKTCAAILSVAEWLEKRGTYGFGSSAARWLREEANRHA